MLTLLLPVDGSEYSDRAVEYAIRRAAGWREPVRAHLLNVQTPLVGVNVKLFIKQESLEGYYREQGMAVLDKARAMLADAGMACEVHISVGDPGEIAVQFARSKGCDEIVMGCKGAGGLAGAVMGSVAQKVARLSPIPVVLVK